MRGAGKGSRGDSAATAPGSPLSSASSPTLAPSGGPLSATRSPTSAARCGLLSASPTAAPASAGLLSTTAAPIARVLFRSTHSAATQNAYLADRRGCDCRAAGVLRAGHVDRLAAWPGRYFEPDVRSEPEPVPGNRGGGYSRAAIHRGYRSPHRIKSTHADQRASGQRTPGDPCAAPSAGPADGVHRRFVDE